ncbi:MAG: hypothetical protein Q9206_003972 [Seirophora lacunosa]
MAQNDTQRQQQMDAWLAGPVSKPPPGVSSDFVNGPSLHEYDIICQTICLTLVTLFVALFNGIQITYVLVILLTKVSILLLYLRLFSPTPALRTTIHINLWANAVFYVACIFAVLFICNPRAALWKPDVGLVHCHDQRTVRIASAAVNGISDVAILVIPISVVWRLQMQRKKKLRAIAVLASGLL